MCDYMCTYCWVAIQWSTCMCHFRQLIGILISKLRICLKYYLLILVRRYIAVIAVGLLSFSIGLASALDINIFVNQDAVWAHALIVSGCFLIFLVARYGVLKFRRVLYNDVRSIFLRVLVLIIPSVSLLFSVWYWRLASTISLGVCGYVSD